MSNNVNVRRVKFQNLDEQGNPEGPPCFGVIASDNEIAVFNNQFSSFEELNKEIKEKGCILDLLDEYNFCDKSNVGTENYYGPL